MQQEFFLQTSFDQDDEPRVIGSVREEDVGQIQLAYEPPHADDENDSDGDDEQGDDEQGHEEQGDGEPPNKLCKMAGHRKPVPPTILSE